MKYLLTILSALIMLCGCRTVRLESVGFQGETQEIFRSHSDSTLLTIRDSIYVKETQRGDTVLMTEFRLKYIEKVNEVRISDTVYIEIVTEKRTEMVKENRFLSSLQSATYILGFLCLFLFLCKRK